MSTGTCPANLVTYIDTSRDRSTQWNKNCFHFLDVMFSNTLIYHTDINSSQLNSKYSHTILSVPILYCTVKQEETLANVPTSLPPVDFYSKSLISRDLN